LAILNIGPHSFKVYVTYAPIARTMRNIKYTGLRRTIQDLSAVKETSMSNELTSNNLIPPKSE
jgi:hypothetical protein